MYKINKKTQNTSRLKPGVNCGSVDPVLEIALLSVSSGKVKQSIALFKKAIKSNPYDAHCYYHLSKAYNKLGKVDKAQKALEQSIIIQPSHSDALNSLGNIYRTQGNIPLAMELFQRSIDSNKQGGEAHNNLAQCYRLQGDDDKAIAHFEMALTIQPNNVPIINNFALVLLQLKQVKPALTLLKHAIKIAPEDVLSQGHLGNAYAQAGMQDKAIEHYHYAINLKSDYGEALNNLGNLYQQQGNWPLAQKYYAQSSKLNPLNANALCLYWLISAKLADWQDFGALRGQIQKYIQHPEANKGLNIHALLMLIDDPALHLQACVQLQRFQYKPRPNKIVATKKDKIRLAYISADFREHPTAFLIVEMLELHDKQNFEVHAISTQLPAEDCPIFERLHGAFDFFHALHEQSDKAIAEYIRNLDIDICIDLSGYTQGNSLSALAYKPAPLQIHFMGYAGGLACDYMDYLIADKYVIPPEERMHYAEKLVFMPNSYQVLDRQQAIASVTPSRAECGLRNDSFIFACFNKTDKISPATFSCWMTILKHVRHGVLWLMADHPQVMENLRNQAQAEDIDPERLIFAKSLDRKQHLARIKNADLFLDTLPYNAHTTAMDALFCGLPVLTCSGRSFAARVGASLLTATQLPELITRTPKAYIDLAVNLAQSPQKLETLGKKLQQLKSTAPLFDTAQFTVDLEFAYKTMLKHHFSGQRPEDIDIDLLQ